MATKRTTRPLDRNIILEVVFPTTNIIIPGKGAIDMKDKDFVVAAVGPDCTRGLKIGDMVEVRGGFGGQPTSDGREWHFICSEADVIGVIELDINEDV